MLLDGGKAGHAAAIDGQHVARLRAAAVLDTAVARMENQDVVVGADLHAVAVPADLVQSRPGAAASTRAVADRAVAAASDPDPADACCDQPYEQRTPANSITSMRVGRIFPPHGHELLKTA